MWLNAKANISLKTTIGEEGHAQPLRSRLIKGIETLPADLDIFVTLVSIVACNGCKIKIYDVVFFCP